jgi:hypothetical protein
MSILIILLTGTLVLAASVNSRAHKSYSYSQTQVTARTAVDSIIEAINDGDSDSNELQKNISLMSVGTSYKIDVDLGSDTSSMGRITSATATCTEKVKMYDDSLTPPQWIDCYTVVISATAELGNESATVSATIINNPEKKTPEGKSSGYIALGSSSFGDQYKLTGGTALGLNKVNNGYTDTSNTFYANNNMEYEADLTVNSSFYTDNVKFIFNDVGKGVSIFGNFTVNNNIYIESNYTVPASGIRYNEIPYFYVDGEFKSNNSMKFNNDPNHPINVYTRYINLTDAKQAIELYGDIVLFDDSQTSNFGANNSVLMNWTSSCVNKTNSYDTTGGSIYSLGNIDVSSDLSVADDLRVSKNLTIKSGTLKVGGDLAVGGTLKIANASDISTLADNVTGTIYCDNIVDSSNNEVDIPTEKASKFHTLETSEAEPITLYKTYQTTQLDSNYDVAVDAAGKTLYNTKVYQNYPQYVDSSGTKKQIYPTELLNELLTGEYCLSPATDAGKKTVDDYLQDMGVSGADATERKTNATAEQLANAQSLLDDYNSHERFQGNTEDTAILETVEKYKREFDLGTASQESSYPSTIPSSVATEVTANIISGTGFASTVLVDDPTDVNRKILTKSCTWYNASFDKYNNVITTTDSEGHNTSVTNEIRTLVIDPGTSELWIKVKGYNIFMNQVNIIIDDSKGGSVKFLFEDGTLDLCNQNPLVTKMFEDAPNTKYDINIAGVEYAEKGGTVIFNYTDTRNSTDDYSYLAAGERYIPNVYFYSSTTGTNLLKTQNSNSSIIGFVRAPNLKLEGKASGLGLGSGSTYTGKGGTQTISEFGLIGYCICSDGEFGNHWPIWYINPNSSGDGSSGGGVVYKAKTWKIASYNFD